MCLRIWVGGNQYCLLAWESLAYKSACSLLIVVLACLKSPSISESFLHSTCFYKGAVITSVFIRLLTHWMLLSMESGLHIPKLVCRWRISESRPLVWKPQLFPRDTWYEFTQAEMVGVRTPVSEELLLVVVKGQGYVLLLNSLVG